MKYGISIILALLPVHGQILYFFLCKKNVQTDSMTCRYTVYVVGNFACIHLHAYMYISGYSSVVGTGIQMGKCFLVDVELYTHNCLLCDRGIFVEKGLDIDVYLDVDVCKFII